MKRIIVDYNKLNENILDLLVSKYPDGYNDGDIISFKNAAGDWIECVEVRTDDTMYLVKVSKRLESAMTEYEDEEEESFEDIDPDSTSDSLNDLK